MNFTANLITLALAICVTSTPTPAKRDINDITNAIAGISTAVVALDDIELAYTGGALTDLQSGSDAVIAATNAATDAANDSAALSDTDALGLVSPIQDLTDKVTTTVNDIIAIKALITTEGGETQILDNLDDQKDAASALATALTDKVPDDLKSIAASLAAGVTDAIQTGIDAYT